MKKFFTITCFLLYTSFLSAEVVKKIEITGNERISDETVKVYGNISLNQDVDNVKINQIIKDLYSTNFFEDIKVSVSNGILFVNLIEYPVINDIIIIGENANIHKNTIL